MNLAELNDIAKKVKEKNKDFKKKVCVCCGAGCLSSGSEPVLKGIQQAVREKGLEREIDVVPSGCMGPCNQGPLVKILPDQTIYQKVSEAQFAPIVESHLVKQEPVRSMLLFSDSRSEVPVDTSQDPYFKRQKKIVLENCGNINPETIEDYISVGGYRAMDQAIRLMTPEEVIAEVKHSRLLGRGGAGFSEGFKWG